MKVQKKNIVMGGLLMILGLVIAMQFQTVKNTAGEGLLSTQKAQQQMKKLEILRNESQSLKDRLAIIEKEIKSYELSDADENLITKNLQTELRKYQEIAGMKSLEGPGLVVSISDPQGESYSGQYESQIIYNYMFIIDIINILNGAGAEAITINDQRILATTEIYPSARSLIVNSVPVTPPINIAAIGDSKALEAALNINYGILYEIKKFSSIQVNIRKENLVVVPSYNRIQTFEFAQPVIRNN
ncbi:DUF881 domain-containing protein [Alkaliphilus pronyensis]|uniref:DUF881 domain-containing protein n=1 Tax=Alkaliphilus pronyensis TaxID=1482732 RepID=A0A6I0FGK3_9FIRM|nr:DUF881 domain-containing protein [Alkaliphilus pronyensis]KAB3537353.1 DUF881 domain-containing protein [Alkaliphilus pronyensis]